MTIKLIDECGSDPLDQWTRVEVTLGNGITKAVKISIPDGTIHDVLKAAANAAGAIYEENQSLVSRGLVSSNLPQEMAATP